MKKELRDQAAHAAAAMMITGMLIVAPSIYTCAIAGFCIGALREITEEGTPVTLSKVWHAVSTSKLDLTFWTFGGIAIAIITGV